MFEVKNCKWEQSTSTYKIGRMKLFIFYCNVLHAGLLFIKWQNAKELISRWKFLYRQQHALMGTVILLIKLPTMITSAIFKHASERWLTQLHLVLPFCNPAERKFLIKYFFPINNLAKSLYLRRLLASNKICSWNGRHLSKVQTCNEQPFCCVNCLECHCRHFDSRVRLAVPWILFLAAILCKRYCCFWVCSQTDAHWCY